MSRLYRAHPRWATRTPRQTRTYSVPPASTAAWEQFLLNRELRRTPRLRAWVESLRLEVIYRTCRNVLHNRATWQKNLRAPFQPLERVDPPRQRATSPG